MTPSPAIVEVAAVADDAAIRALVRRQVMPGRVQLSMARDPDFSLGCAVTGDDCRIVVARNPDDGAVVGVACRSARRVFLNGRETRIGYLGQLRIDDRFRGRGLVPRGFSKLEELHRVDPVPVYLVSIVEGNEEALGVLVRNRRPSFPVFQEAARYTTLALPTWWPARTAAGRDTILSVTPELIPALVQFLRLHGARRQFCTAWTEHSFLELARMGLRLDDVRLAMRSGAIAGVLALWDQTAYKQAIVRGYDGWLRALAAPGSLCLPRSVLPRVGDEIRSVYASLVCVADDDADVFRLLLRDAYRLARARRFDYLLVGLDARDPLLEVVRRYPHFSYPSRLYLARWPGGSGAEVGHDTLDDRLTYVDIATL